MSRRKLTREELEQKLDRLQKAAENQKRRISDIEKLRADQANLERGD
jgi:hypothetical protein